MKKNDGVLKIICTFADYKVEKALRARFKALCAVSSFKTKGRFKISYVELKVQSLNPET